MRTYVSEHVRSLVRAYYTCVRVSVSACVHTWVRARVRVFVFVSE